MPARSPRSKASRPSRTSVTVRDAVAAIESIAPRRLAEPWDKVGLQLGDEARPIATAMLCIDLTEPVLAEAVKAKAGLVLAYHPTVFHPLQRITSADWKGRVVMEAIEQKIAVYSPHTALDCVRGGMTDWLCAGLGAGLGKGHGKGVAEPIEARAPKMPHYKVVVFVPHDAADAVRSAMGDAGAGAIGAYSGCSYNAEGFGTFLPGEGTNPAIGSVGRFERVAELRLEMIVPPAALGRVLAAARQAHPYEEPAIDAFKLADEPLPDEQAEGPGRLLTLNKPTSAKTLVQRAKRHLGMKHLKVAFGAGEEAEVRTVAVCPGAGGSLFEGCPHADAYLTGEMQHHQVLDLVQQGKTVILAGHTNTERPYLPTLASRLADRLTAVDWRVSQVDAAPMAVQ